MSANPLIHRLLTHFKVLPPAKRRAPAVTLLRQCFDEVNRLERENAILKLRLGDPEGEDTRPLMILDTRVAKRINRVIDPTTGEVDVEANEEFIRLLQAHCDALEEEPGTNEALNAFKETHTLEWQPFIDQWLDGEAVNYSCHPDTWKTFTDDRRRQFRTIVAPDPVEAEAVPAERSIGVDLGAPGGDQHAEYLYCQKHDCRWTGPPVCPQCQNESEAVASQN